MAIRATDRATRNALGVLALSAILHAAGFAFVTRRARTATDDDAQAGAPELVIEASRALVEVSAEPEVLPPEQGPSRLRDPDTAPIPPAPRAKLHGAGENASAPDDPAKGHGVDVEDVGGLLASLRRRLANPLPGGFVHLPDREPPEASLRPPYPWVSDGRIDRDVIKRVVRANAAHVRACSRPSRGRAALAGHVAVTLKVGLTGRVVAARDLGGDVDDAEVRACIAQSFVGLTFPPPERGSATFTVPVHVKAR